ncbi:MAG: GTP cyclohydrolase, FolE2/MptA family [Candidatus Aureabacteria bacterium]|nr:GTP cyclohydrolase, FolE2/MptA family [Candidatus Auribacterota bacterium]
MQKEKRFLVDVGMRDLPFPMRVLSKVDPNGQLTVANISIAARIMGEFEAQWIDKFIRIVHEHRDKIGTKTLKVNIMDYLKELNASMVKIDFNYPFFIEKLTPVSREKCLVRYVCAYSAKATLIQKEAKIIYVMNIPAITTYPASFKDTPGGLFGQLSMLTIETQSTKDIYPEDLVALVDKHAVAPVYSYLSSEDQHYIIQKVHSESKSSVIVTDEIKNELAHNRNIEWYAVRCTNFGMLHSYSTMIGTEKSMWVPFSGYESEEV